MGRQLGRVITVIVAALAGAALFHGFYLSLSPLQRCRWDHAFDAHARAICEERSAATYGAHAREQMDELIDRVAR
jgi:hypothetical protein